MTNHDDKRQYEAPALVAGGSLEELTQGASTGTKLDASYQIGTPFGDLTFS
ncbi:lasso RiPP family leader peptide-containing protein [Pseudoroseicyclus tamaricis]|uniref:Lasso RiPP family leader peptide-containing protein n=1 Tax=Pseudoroseicyclus tamaricis TaxID=2705421 RepID=A0A6B2JYG2_9RHOB|nr:lasso RiPP family leader peptide-containing protein [Pseudoroseicyclus tamaricis]NDV01344.1 lasso RiPP family leader peptide-containing protein [Pseudoroseicyclus tamaricis]